MPVPPRIVNDVLYVTGKSCASFFVAGAVYLVTLEDETCCSARCK